MIGLWVTINAHLSPAIFHALLAAVIVIPTLSASSPSERNGTNSDSEKVNGA
ncbi:unannotated protein [freshwater metagenome]|uniref:Unannotated protein n=1 Tax=freshwater metagenome TaxID=449393 RepID=A0A6J6KZX8_9ZZZZ